MVGFKSESNLMVGFAESLGMVKALSYRKIDYFVYFIIVF